MKTKNLKEYLESLESDTIVAIGSGSSFMYFGEAGNMDEIDKRFNEYMTNSKKKLTKCRKDLSSLILNPPKLTGNSKKDDKVIFSHGDGISKKVASIRSNEKYVDTYLPVLDRKVKDIYHNEHDNCTTVIIEGLENGSFWFKSEYDKKFNK